MTGQPAVVKVQYDVSNGCVTWAEGLREVCISKDGRHVLEVELKVPAHLSRQKPASSLKKRSLLR
jgi:hypothetical protein